jgi:hypothetical protein
MTALDPIAIRASLARLTPGLCRLPTDEDIAAWLPTVFEPMPATLAEFTTRIEVEGGSRGVGGVGFAAARVVADALPPGPAVRPGGDYCSANSVPPPIVTHYGDLHVIGDLEFAGVLIVLGDLRVDGSISDWQEWSSLWVTGEVNAPAMHLCSWMWVGGTARIDTTILGRYSTFYAGGGLEASLDLRDDSEGHGHLGEVRAGRRLDADDDPAAVADALRPEFYQWDSDGFLNIDHDAIVAAALAGRPVLADRASQPSRSE